MEYLLLKMNLLLDVPKDIFYEYQKWLELMQLIPLCISCKKINNLIVGNKYYMHFLKHRQHVSCGSHFTMIVKNHQLYTCGLNIMSAPGTFDMIPTPKKISSDKNKIVSICCGDNYVIITNMNEVYSIGYNRYVQLASVSGVVAVYAASGGNHVVLQGKGCLYVCGKNATGQLGLGYYGDGVALVKNDFFDSMDILHVSLGGNHTCVLTRNKVWVFGSNDRGQLGLGHYMNVPTPNEVILNGIGVTSSCGGKHSFVLTTSGLYGAGSNIYGELGLEEGYYKSFTKIPIDDVINVRCGEDYTYILTNTNTYVCGNSFHGQLGFNKEQPRIPVIFKHRLNIKNVFCGYEHVVIEGASGKYHAIGNNKYQQLGLGKYKNKTYCSPMQIKI